MNYLCTILYHRSRPCDELSHICTIETKCVSNHSSHNRRQEKKRNIARLLERLGLALFCGGCWSKGTAARKNWLTRRCILIFNASRVGGGRWRCLTGVPDNC